MKHILAAFFVIGSSVSIFAGPPKYSIEVFQIETAWRAEVRFADASRQSVTLIGDGEDAPPWKPHFDISPDGRWILYVQKTGSGDNAAWLYTVDDVGRVLRMKTRLDLMAWQLSDTISPVKHSQLHHTGIDGWKWTDHQTLTFTLQGSEAERPGNGVTLHLEYDLAKHTLSKQ